jgi:hypothetical protein
MRPTIRAAFRPRTDDMPRYIATVSTDRSPEEVFAYLSDLTTFAEWDPGVERVELVAGTAGGDDAVYDVTLDRGMTLRYEVTQFVPGHQATVVADNGRFRSVDVISVERSVDGSVATYDATLTFSGVLSPLSVLLGPIFKRIGDKAAAGLERVLEGRLV